MARCEGGRSTTRRSSVPPGSGPDTVGQRSRDGTCVATLPGTAPRRRRRAGDPSAQKSRARRKELVGEGGGVVRRRLDGVAVGVLNRLVVVHELWVGGPLIR